MNAYTITRESEYGGLMVVRYHGRKIGTAQTELAARLVRRNHAQRMSREAEAAALARIETQSDRDAWYDMDR